MKKFMLYLVLIAFAVNAVPACAQGFYGTRLDIQLGEGYDEKYREKFDSYKSCPVWSSDEKWIAFIGMNRTSIFVVPSEGGEAVLVYKLPETVEQKWINMLCFSPDSQVITFGLWVLDEDRGSYREYLDEEETMYRSTNLIPAIENINMYTGEHRVITEGGFHPNWCRDSRYLTYIYFDVNTYIDTSQIECNGVPVIYDTVTDETRFLIEENVPQGPYFDENKYQYPVFSPDGSHIIMNYTEYNAGQLVQIPFEGGEPELLTDYRAKDWCGERCLSITCSPDGEWILFHNSISILAYNTLTGETFDVFTGENYDRPDDITTFKNIHMQQPNWSPDGTKFCYQLYTCNTNGFSTSSITLYDFNPDRYTGDGDVMVEDENPSNFAILGNYPNPFNLSTTIEFSLHEAGHVKLELYDITGQKIWELVSRDMRPGVYSAVWDGRDENGIEVSSGIYFSHLSMDNTKATNCMMLVK